MTPDFLGDGRVIGHGYVNPLFPQIPYRLEGDHTLRKIPQTYFRVGVSATVHQPFPIYSRPGIQRLAMLRTGTRVRILKSDLGDWLYIRAGRRTYGWMNIRWNSLFPAFGWVAAG
jgi:hypothetical protein